MSEPTPATTTIEALVHVFRCPRCEVTWRGTSAVPCWCCGAPGDRRGDVRVVAD